MPCCSARGGGYGTWSSAVRAHGGCLGAGRRGRTWQAARSRGEPHAGCDPRMSEWGNPAGVMPRHRPRGRGQPGELKHLSTLRDARRRPQILDPRVRARSNEHTVNSNRPFASRPPRRHRGFADAAHQTSSAIPPPRGCQIPCLYKEIVIIAQELDQVVSVDADRSNIEVIVVNAANASTDRPGP